MAHLRDDGPVTTPAVAARSIGPKPNPTSQHPGSWVRNSTDAETPGAPSGGSVDRVMLRCTARLRKSLADSTLAVEDPSESDWYANLLWIQGRRCLLVTHAGTLFSVCVPDVRAADLRRMAGFVAPRIAAQLAAEGFPENSLGELDVTSRIAKTADRSIVGSMNDQAALCQHIVADSGGLQHLDLADLHRHLQRNILSARGYVPPIELVSAWTAP